MRHLIQSLLAITFATVTAAGQTEVQIPTVLSETPQDRIPVGPEAPPKAVSEAEQRLIGAWGGDGHTLHIERLPMDDLPSGLYVELARDAAPHHPISQQVWILHQLDGEVRARVFEFSEATQVEEFYQGAWAAPGRWTPPPAAVLVPLGDLRVERAGDRLRFRSDRPLPASRHAAWDLDMEVVVDPETLAWKAAALSAEGESTGGGETIELSRLEESPFPVTVREDGLVFIDYRTGEGPKVVMGDSVFLDFGGYLADGRQIDAPSSSRPRSMAVPGPMPPGVNEALIGLQDGSVRRVLVPPQLGAAMDRRGVIAPDAQIVYHIRVYSMKDNTPE